MAAAAAWAVAGIALFTCYLHASRTAAVNSDGASNALQAWDMLHGNPLLRGWKLSDVSFATTELPQYALIELFRGLGPDVVHIAGAMTYTLMVLLAALLAKGRASGAEAALRCMLAAGIMLAPQLGTGVYVLLLSPDHVGSTVPVLVLWLVLDRFRARWVAPVAVVVLLTWGLVADSVLIFSAVLPVIGTCVFRAYQSRRAGAPWAATIAAVATAGAALAAAWLSGVIVRAISAAGGFQTYPVGSMLSSFSALPHNALVTIQGLLVLFGANFFSRPAGLAAALLGLHLVGLGLAAAGTGAALRRFGSHDLAVQLLAAGTLVSLAAYLFGTRATDLHSARDMAAVLPFSAALAGRLLAARLARAKLVPALALVAAGYLLSLGRVVAQPPVAAQDTQLVRWLESHQLQSGLAGYWDASIATLDSGGKLRLSPVLSDGSAISAGYWEIKQSWYDAAGSTANFVVLVTPPPAYRYPSVLAVRNTFGQPASIFFVGRYTILVWTKNLLGDLGPAIPPPPGPGQAPAGALGDPPGGRTGAGTHYGPVA